MNKEKNIGKQIMAGKINNIGKTKKMSEWISLGFADKMIWYMWWYIECVNYMWILGELIWGSDETLYHLEKVLEMYRNGQYLVNDTQVHQTSKYTKRIKYKAIHHSSVTRLLPCVLTATRNSALLTNTQSDIRSSSNQWQWLNTCCWDSNNKIIN